MLGMKHILLLCLPLSSVVLVSAQWGGLGNLWGGGGGYRPSYGHHGYGYGSGICAGARQRHPSHYNQFPEYGGFDPYQQHPVQVVAATTPKPVPKECSLPTKRDATVFDQACLFPGESEQVSCSSRGHVLAAGTTAVLKCKAPEYYSETGAVLLEICKDGKWYGDSSTLTCKSSPTAAPARNYVVDYVQKPQPTQPAPYYNTYTQAPSYETPSYTPTHWNPAPATVYPSNIETTTTTSTTTTTEPTTTTTTTTPRPYYQFENIDWRSRTSPPSIAPTPWYDSNSGKCQGLIAKQGAVIQCLSKTSQPGNRGYLVGVSDCADPQIPGTEATYKCQLYYEPAGGLATQYRKCKDEGTWTGSEDGFVCNLECGKSNPVGRLPLITSGEATVLGQWPWHAALFVRDRADFQNVCGGTLISRRAILTAGHCVNMHYSSILREVWDVRVDLGRYFREKDDPYVQKFQVEKIVSHPAYNPFVYESDIAIVILKGSAQIGYHVRPICFPKTQNAAFDELQLAEGTYGTVVGWGADENGQFPEDLRSAKLKVIGYRDCIESFGDFDNGALLAKSTTFCAGNNNGTNVCMGDSGGGAYFGIKTSTGSTQWYLQGLVSVGVNAAQGEKKCDPEKVSIFTRISPYSDWIVRVLSENDAL